MTDDKSDAARDEGDHQLSNSRNIISRDEAKALGLKRFFTGEPCKHGHIAERSVRSSRCLECGRARSAKWKAAKARIMVLARALMRPTEKGKHWGPITAKFFEVLKALLWAFHNAKSGRCFPSYKTIARKADCGEDTVARAIVALERVGLLSWCNRLARVSIRGVVKVIRTSNAYWFNDPGSKMNLSQEPVSWLIKRENKRLGRR